jgi:SPP1 gp7 family putative phage head morphogenesis protein
VTAERASKGLFDRGVRHRIALERYAEGEVREILRFIQELERDTEERVAVLRVRSDLSRGERSSLDLLENFLRELRLVYAEAYAALRERAFQGFDDLSAFEAEFHTGSLLRALDDLEGVAGAAGAAAATAAEIGVLTPTVAQLRAVVRSRPAQGKLLAAWFETMEANQIDRIETAIRIGFTEGETIAQLRDRLSNVWTLNRRGAEAVIRTAVTHVAAEVAQESYEANPDLVKEVEWVAVLDSRTTDICRARDGKRFPLNKGPRPPAHINCRSTVVPVLEGVDPPARLTYGEWLARQTEEQQREILGPSRFALFKRGQLPLDRFVGRDGEPLTLDEIRQREPEAFRRAGIGARP